MIIIFWIKYEYEYEFDFQKKKTDYILIFEIKKEKKILKR